LRGKSEVYFFERWYQLLKPGGRIGVVLPESFFSVEDGIHARLFLYKHFNIRAIVALPNHAFSPHTTTSTSLLFAQKKTQEEEKQFQELWDKFAGTFDAKYNDLNTIIATPKSSLSFELADKNKGKSIYGLLDKVEKFLSKEFGHGFVILPYFADRFLFNAENFNQLKKKIKDSVSHVKNRWILFNVTNTIKSEFYNFAISNIGYKAGKKGSKDKPNELMAIYDNDGNRIYNLKYSNAWHRIDADDNNTVLGQLKRFNIWP
jgi:type I restriction enzyme M protein